MATRAPARRWVLSRIALALLIGSIGGQAPADEADEPEEENRSAIRFEAPFIHAHPGERVRVPLIVTSETELSLAAFSLEYDSGFLGLDAPSLTPDVESILERHPEAEDHFTWSSDDAAGWLQVQLVMDFLARDEIVIPAGRFPVVYLTFDVSDSAAEGTYPIVFTSREDADYDGEFEDSERNRIYNHARDDEEEFDDETEFDDGEEPELSSGGVMVSIIGDVSVFARGDANADRILDVSDPVLLLAFLFQNGTAPSCEDAADANDDGELDMSDPIAIFMHLFLDAGSAVIPSGLVSDLTPDPLGCASY